MIDIGWPNTQTLHQHFLHQGRLTDGKGKTIECKDAIFIMTSNLAQDEIAKHGMELREEAERLSKQRRAGKLGKGINSCYSHWLYRFLCVVLVSKQWTDPQLSIMIIYNSTWSILIQSIRIILSGDNLT